MKNSLLSTGDAPEVCRVPVRILKGILDPNALDLLMNRYHFDVDRRPGSLLVLENGLVFGAPGNHVSLTQEFALYKTLNEKGLVGFQAVMPTLYKQGFTYAILLPEKIQNGLIVTAWDLPAK